MAFHVRSPFHWLFGSDTNSGTISSKIQHLTRLSTVWHYYQQRDLYFSAPSFVLRTVGNNRDTRRFQGYRIFGAEEIHTAGGTPEQD